MPKKERAYPSVHADGCLWCKPSFWIYICKSKLSARISPCHKPLSSDPYQVLSSPGQVPSTLHMTSMDRVTMPAANTSIWDCGVLALFSWWPQMLEVMNFKEQKVSTGPTKCPGDHGTHHQHINRPWLLQKVPLWIFQITLDLLYLYKRWGAGTASAARRWLLRPPVLCAWCVFSLPGKPLPLIRDMNSYSSFKT